MSSKKEQIIQQVQQETAMANARLLVQSINNNCFERCVPKPSTSLSSGEASCYTTCMEKYMKAWDAVSRIYISRLQQEQQQRAMLGGAGSGGMFEQDS